MKTIHYSLPNGNINIEGLKCVYFTRGSLKQFVFSSLHICLCNLIFQTTLKVFLFRKYISISNITNLKFWISLFYTNFQQMTEWLSLYNYRVLYIRLVGTILFDAHFYYVNSYEAFGYS